MYRYKSFTRSAAVVAFAVLAAACSTTPKMEEEVGEVSELYNRGQDSLEARKYKEAIHTFEELERQHPYSGWATRAQMMVVYANYRSGNFDEAVLGADRFINLHPGHKDLPYMYYLKALSYYDRISDVKRDQGYTTKALQALEELVRLYPNSDYARDAKLKITLCKDHIAGQEMMVGRFYQKQQRFMAAINRYRGVVENYQTSTQTPEALYRLTESYLALGIHSEAQMAAAVLGHNFPASDWYKDAYALLKEKNLEPAHNNTSWLGKVYQGVLNVF